MKSYTEFNLNDEVQVKLTEHGIRCLRKEHEELRAHFPRSDFEFRAPPSDSDGWSTWQLHSLMGRLGKYTSMGLPLPFETTIRIEKPSE